MPDGYCYEAESARGGGAITDRVVHLHIRSVAVNQRGRRAAGWGWGKGVRRGLRVVVRCAVALAAAQGALLAAPRRAAAQERPDSAAQDSVRRDSLRAVRLLPVTITVLQTPFDLTRAPYAVTQLGIREIQGGRPGVNLAEALVAVPGVQVDNRYNYALGERISVRGYGARAQFGVRGVRVLVDGIPATLPDGQTTLNHVDVASLGRIEAVRGPASAIYGNASGGVLQLESATPPDARFEQRVRYTGGADGLSRLQSQTGGRLGDVDTPLNYFLNVSRLNYGGFRDHADAKNLVLSSGIDVGGERTKLQLVAHAADYEARNPGSLSDSLLRVNREQAFARNVVQRTGEEGKHGEVGATVRQVVGSGQVVASAWAIGRELDNPIPDRVIDLERRAGGARAAYAGRVAVGAVPVQWAVGGEAQRQRDERLNFANDSGRRADLILDQREIVTTTAAYARLAGDLGERLSVLAAARVDRARFEARDRYLADSTDDSGERTMSAFNPSLGVSYAAGRGATFYANVATAFETPTTTELANRPTGAGGFNPELDPQRSTSFEVGATTRLRGLGLAQVAVYHSRIRDALIPFEVEGAPGRVFFRNAGSAVHRGVELGATLLALPDVTLRAAYTFTDAKFDEYVVGGTSFDGNRVPGVSPHRVDAVLSYSVPGTGALGGLFLEVEERYLSRTPVNDANAPATASPAYALTNLRVGLESARVGGVELAPFLGVTNVFDREYNTAVTVNAFGRRFYEPGPARAVYAGVSLAAGVR